MPADVPTLRSLGMDYRLGDKIRGDQRPNYSGSLIPNTLRAAQNLRRIKIRMESPQMLMAPASPTHTSSTKVENTERFEGWSEVMGDYQNLTAPKSRESVGPFGDVFSVSESAGSL